MAVHGWHIGFGIAYLIWGAIYWIGAATNFLTRPDCIVGKDYLYHLVGAALVVHAISLLVSGFAYDSYASQLANRLVVFRWINYGISQSLIFVVIAAAAGLGFSTGFDAVAVLVFVGFLGVALAYAQSSNEALRCADGETASDRDGSWSWWIEGFLMATAIFLALAITFIVVGLQGPNPSISGARWFVVLFPLITYFLLHTAIFFILTNNDWLGIRSSGWREVVFFIADAFILLSVSIATLFDWQDLTTGCP